MKLSVSLPGEDVAFLDGYANAHAYASRSAVVHQVIAVLRLGELHRAYGESWAEWDASGEAELLDAERIGEQLGRLSDQLMRSLDDALRLHLAL